MGAKPVVIREGESFDSLLRRFRTEVTRSRILSDVKKKRYFVSKSEQRRRAQRKAIGRERKRLYKERARYGQ